MLVFAPEPALAEHAGARVVSVPSLPFPPYPGLRAGLPDPRILLELARFRPQVLHAVGPVCLGVWGMAAARALRIPVVASYHTDLPAYLPEYGLGFAQRAAWPLLRRVHNAAVSNLCPSRHTQRELRAHGIQNVGLWRGGVDTELVPSREALARDALPPHGRAPRPAGRALRRTPLAGEEPRGAGAGSRTRCPACGSRWWATGPRARSSSAASRAGPVQFLGFLRGEELAAAFASADLFVMPSTTETLGFVVLEAMSSGLPVVAARAGGIPDLVDDGENGLLYDPAEPAAAAKAVAELLAHPGRRLDLVRAGAQDRASAAPGSRRPASSSTSTARRS